MFKKILATTLATTIIFGGLYVPTKAANSTSEDGSLQSLVTMQIASSWIVTVPDSITLGANQSAPYDVSVGGDVANDTAISVVPDSSFTLTNGTDRVTANVTQEKQSWMGSEIGDTPSTTTGQIVVTNEMSAGLWAGSLNFTVNCTEDLGDIVSKRELMQTIDLYCMGDSIIDGYLSGTNGFYGTAEAIDNLYGTKTFKNYAVTGASLTLIETLRPSIYQQAYLALDRIKNSGGTTRTTAIVLDGGVNDIILDKADTSKTFTISNMSDNPANGHYDFATTMSNLLYLFGEYSEQNPDHPMNYPIVYVIPKADDHNAELDQIAEQMEFAKTIYPNLIVLDTRDMFTASDMAEDFTHLNQSGQTKLAHAIVDAIYDFYN